jgi:hypothetical protein
MYETVCGVTLADVDADWLHEPMAEPWIRLTHRPTGITAEGRGEHAQGEALNALMTKLAGEGGVVTGEACPLTKDEILQVLRECVTVVKPGEALVICVADLTPRQVSEYQQSLNVWYEDGGLPFRAFVLPGGELGVVEASDG